MAESEYVRFVEHNEHVIQYDGQNSAEVTAFLHTDTWTEDTEGRDVQTGDWLYLDKENQPAIVSNRRKQMDTKRINESPA